MTAAAKPVIVGMNNPYDSDPKYALYPAPTKSAGYRLYTMLREAYERHRIPVEKLAWEGKTLLRQSYIDGFDRCNVLSKPTWCVSEAREEGARLVRSTLPGRRVVILGRAAAHALGIPRLGGYLGDRAPWFERRECHSPLMQSEGLAPFTAWVIPHPSGLCREYNDPDNRQRAGAILLALYEGREP